MIEKLLVVDWSRRARFFVVVVVVVVVDNVNLPVGKIDKKTV